MRRWWSKLARAFGRRDLVNELQQEMEAHLQFLIEEHLERGMPPEEARAAARRHFGSATTVRERGYQSWQFPTLESFLQDLRFAARGIWRARVFSFIVILTLAVGIGANTAIFSAVYAVLLKPLPFPSGERLVGLRAVSALSFGMSRRVLGESQRNQRNLDQFRALADGESLLRVDGCLPEGRSDAHRSWSGRAHTRRCHHERILSADRFSSDTGPTVDRER